MLVSSGQPAPAWPLCVVGVPSRLAGGSSKLRSCSDGGKLRLAMAPAESVAGDFSSLMKTGDATARVAHAWSTPWQGSKTGASSAIVADEVAPGLLRRPLWGSPVPAGASRGGPGTALLDHVDEVAVPEPEQDRSS